MALVIFSSSLFSQDCSVAIESLKGTYTGDCKKGMAEGKGKATGADSYEGHFKAGFPDGEGVYTWSNGNAYSGSFSKGHLTGKGIMYHKNHNGTDSIQDGYWKNDKFIGKYLVPYKVNSLSSGVTQVTVKRKKDALDFNRVNILVFNTTSSTASFNIPATKMKVDNVIMSSGSFTRTEFYEYSKKTETILFDVTYPAHMQLRIASELVDIDLFEEGGYIIEVNINK